MKITSVRPWLVKSSFSYWGEYLFVEVTTDEGISGWGEITSTTKIANRALASILRQVGEQLKGEDPAQIERLWHKTFRSFTYMGSRGAACEVTSAIDIALWDIRGKALGLPVYELLGGAVRDELPPVQERLQAQGVAPAGTGSPLGGGAANTVAAGPTSMRRPR